MLAIFSLFFPGTWTHSSHKASRFLALYKISITLPYFILITSAHVLLVLPFHVNLPSAFTYAPGPVGTYQCMSAPILTSCLSTLLADCFTIQITSDLSKFGVNRFQCTCPSRPFTHSPVWVYEAMINTYPAGFLIYCKSRALGLYACSCTLSFFLRGLVLWV